MKDFIRMGDIVCYVSRNKLELGRVVRIGKSCSEYTIVPLTGKNTKKRRAKDLITTKRLLRMMENSKYVV